MKRITLLFLFIFTAWTSMFSQVDPCYVLTEVLREVDRAVVKGKYDEALRMLEKVKSDPKNRQCPEMKDGVVDFKIKDVKERINRRKNEQASASKPSSSQSSMTVSQMNKLGDDYYYGRNGKTKDYAEAVKWYRKSAEQGNAYAQCFLGFMYERGLGVTKDYAEAVRWYRKAADQGNVSSQYNLGVMYERGLGVTKDNAEAVRWYRKAAEQGNASGQYNLGFMYENGYGVTKDLTEARKWYEKAAAQGNEYAKGRLKVLNGN